MLKSRWRNGHNMATILSKEIKAGDDIEDNNPRALMTMAALFTLSPISLLDIAAIPSHSHSIIAIPTKISATARLMSK